MAMSNNSIQLHTDSAVWIIATLLATFLCLLLTLLVNFRYTLSNLGHYIQRKMAEASAADGKMKDLKISETKKKKDGNPQKAAKKPQQQKKKVGTARDEGRAHVDWKTD
jgi:hypothetical protein